MKQSRRNYPSTWSSWSPEQDRACQQFYQDGLPLHEIGKRLGRSIEAIKVRCKRHYARLPGWPQIHAARRRAGAACASEQCAQSAPAVEAPENPQRGAELLWRSRYQKLDQAYKELLVEMEHGRELRNLAAELAANMRYTPAPAPVPSKGDDSGTPQSLVLMLSDTHVGQIVKPEQTLHLGGYNFDVFLDRLAYMTATVSSIRRGHIPTPIKELVIPILGDMVHGALSHHQEAAQAAPVLNMVFQGAHALAQSIRSMSTCVPRVRVECCAVGNHGRWGDQPKPPTRNRYSNLDGMLYCMLQTLLADNDRIEVNFDEQPFRIFDIQGWRFHASHGDHLRGGDLAMRVPAHAINRMVASTSQLFSNAGQVPPNYYLVGHLHREITLPHIQGYVIYNGSFVGIDEYGLTGGLAAPPTQRLFCVHPRYGRTAEWSITLRFATCGSGRTAFTLPARMTLP